MPGTIFRLWRYSRRQTKTLPSQSWPSASGDQQPKKEKKIQYMVVRRGMCSAGRTEQKGRELRSRWERVPKF